MEEMIPELITAAKYIGLIAGSSITAIIVKNWLGKTKEEAEIVLNWEKIHAERDRKLLTEIKRLEEKIEAFSGLIEDMKESHEKERLIWVDRYNKQERYTNGLEIELENYRNGTD